MGMTEIVDNKPLSRFELAIDGATAYANYQRAGDRVIITHTETPRALRGQGIGSRLVAGALASIRADGLKVIAGCSFVADYLRRHREFADLIG